MRLGKGAGWPECPYADARLKWSDEESEEAMIKNKEYRGEFQQWSHVAESFSGECPQSEPRYVFAEYQVPGYEGYSTVITSDDGEKFRVVEGSHCSCYGLEGQWEPTEHTKPEVEKMMEASYGFFHDNLADLSKWLKRVTR